MSKSVWITLALAGSASLANANAVPVTGGGVNAIWNQAGNGSFEAILIEFVPHVIGSRAEATASVGADRVIRFGTAETFERAGDGGLGGSDFRPDVQVLGAGQLAAAAGGNAFSGGLNGPMNGNGKNTTWSDFSDDDSDPHTVIPLPSASLLAGLGLAGVAVRRRRDSN